MLWQWRELLHRLALGCCIGSRGNAGFCLAVERLRHRRWAAHMAQCENFDLKFAAFILHCELIADTDLASRLGFMAV